MMNNQPQIIIFTGAETNYYSRSAGPYRVATELDLAGFNTLVIPNCTLLTRKGYQEIFKKYGSKNLLWVGFSTTFLRSLMPIDHEQWHDHPSSIHNFIQFDYAIHPKDNLNKSTSLDPIYSPATLINVLELAQTYNSNCKLVLGGANSNFGNTRWDYPDLFRFYSKAELAIVEFTRQCAQGKFEPVWKSNDSWDNNEFKSSFIRFKPGDYVAADEWLPLEVSRGCAFNCGFCNYDRKDLRDSHKHPAALRQEIISHYEQFGVTRFVIGDDLYNDSLHKVELMYDEVWSKLPFQAELCGYLRLDMLWNRPQQAEILLASGWRYGSFGIETMHDRAGQKVGKGLGGTRIKEAIAMLNDIWQNRCIIHALMIAGLPFEPKESIETNADWLYNNPNVLAVNYTPLHLMSPNMIKEFKLAKTNAISADPYNYGVTWTDDHNWINDQGVSFEWAKDFCAKVINRKTPGSFAHYADDRMSGQTHQDIIDSLSNYHPNNRNTVYRTKLGLVEQRLQKFLSA